MLTPVQVKTHTTSPEADLVIKNYSEGFKDLTEKEKNYAYYFTRASWEGALMCFHQISYESPVIMCLGTFLFSGKTVASFKEAALKAGSNDEDFKFFIAYFTGVLSNLGNYISFGHKKIVPNLNEEQFLKIFKSVPHFGEFEKVFGCSFQEIWDLIGKEIFIVSSPYDIINLPTKGGTTGYFSRSLSDEELDMMNRFLASRKQSPLNTRSFKKEENGKTIYEITVGSTEHEVTEHEFEGKTLRIVKGEFSEYLKGVVDNLEKALPFARSELQANMLKDYIAHFKSGDVDLHIDSQKKWIQDKGPVIETNIGYIETYLDPQNIRAYFEGFVSIVNKTRSQKYTTLVDAYKEIIEFAPWPRNFCKDKFQRPDFTSLDIIAFAGPGCPLGINIPNYDLVRNDYGFKNVYLANNFSNYSNVNYKFLSPEDSKLLNEYTGSAYTLHVALHELIGHGSGKLFYADENGKLNFDTETTKNLLTGEKITTHYKHGETWNEKFGQISCSYEECRADTCGIFLGFEPTAYKIFGFTKDNIREAMASTVLNHMRKAILGLKLYNPSLEKWGQAHTQGAFVFVSFILRNQNPKEKVLDIMLSAEEDDFLFVLNRDRLMTSGREIVGELLKYLQQYKSCADFEEADKFYADYSAVSPFFLKIRKIVMDNQKPRRLDMYNEIMKEEEKITENVSDPTMERFLETVHLRWNQGRDELIQRVLREWKWRGNSQTLRV